MSNQILVSHEVPKSLFKESRKFNDYDYMLDFLYEDEEYRDFYKKSLKQGRKVLFDNSLFEFHPVVPSMERFYEHVCEIKPTWYIVTDVLNNKEATIEKMEEWKKKYSSAPGKRIGVVQGDTLKDLVDCYKYMEKNVDKIAIPFDSAGFLDMLNVFGLPGSSKSIKEIVGEDNILDLWCVGRQVFINYLVRNNIWNNNIPHHLLGASYVREFSNPAYRNISIESLDTSNPVVYGIFKMKYDIIGNSSKPSTKLCDLINAKLDSQQVALIRENVQVFKSLLGR